MFVQWDIFLCTEFKPGEAKTIPVEFWVEHIYEDFLNLEGKMYIYIFYTVLT